MKFKYQGIGTDGQPTSGHLEANTRSEAALNLQRQGYASLQLKEASQLWDMEFNFFSAIKHKDIVLISRQIATLFTAQISAIRVFAMLSEESESAELGNVLKSIVEELEGGSSLSKAMSKHPNVFSNFYVNMVASGEETGKLSQTFEYLADYMERNYELSSKAKNALIYPAFVISTFVGVMILMMTYIIPKIGVILTESGQELPTYTKIVLGTSSFLVNYGIFILTVVIIFAGSVIYYLRTPEGKRHLSEVALRVPYVGALYKKLYLSRIADNMNTMLSSGIPMVKALETTKTIIGNLTYEQILDTATDEVRSGRTLSDALRPYPEYVPSIMPQMIKVGEESGNVGQILKTLSEFYTREVSNAVDTLVSLIEPAMIVMLGLGVGTLLASVLLPIYNVSTSV